MKTLRDLRKSWIDELGEACSEYLSATSQYKFEIKAARLYGELEESLIREQSDGNSIRRILTNEEDADRLVESLHNSDKYRDADLDQRSKEIGAVLAVAFAGVISARLDDNYKAIGWMYEWCVNRFGDGHNPENFTFLTAARYYHDFGEYRYASISLSAPRSEWPALPSGEEPGQDRSGGPDVIYGDLNRLLQKAEQESEEVAEKIAEDYTKRLHLFVVEAIAQLPPYLTEEVNRYTNFLDVLKQSDMAEHNRFSYILSRAAYAQDRLDEAIALAIKALQSAPAGDRTFIAQCRQYLLTLEQEKVARTTIVANSKDELRPELDALLEENKQDMKQEMDDQSEAFQKTVDTVQKTVEKEIKESLLRVIEILGIFLAVASVAVTAVGGISVGDSIWQSLGIFALGYLAIVSLFFILRLMVFGPLIVARKDSRDDNRQAENHKPSDPPP